MAKFTVEDIDKARRVSIQAILGLPRRRRTSIKCPFHRDRTPSCSIYSDGGFHCFGCSKHGNNAVDFLLALGYRFPEAVNELKKYV